MISCGEIVALSAEGCFASFAVAMRYLTLIGFFSAVLVAIAPADPAASPQAGRKAKRDPAADAPAGERRTYKHSAGKPRELELYFPPNHDPAKQVPGLILFHGGGWGGGTLEQFRAACAYFASRGLVCATAEYRMLSGTESKALPAGETKKRVCVTDAKSAIRWFKEHAGELGIDPARIIAGGGSAGGHISTLATLNPGLNDPADPAGFDTSVVAYLWFNPAFAPEDVRDPEIDVLRFVKKDLPPAFVCFGTKDEWKKGWDSAHAKWREAGCSSIALHLAEGQPHGFFNAEPWRSVSLIAADRFLAGLGFLEGEPTLQAPASGETLVK
jgi:acetyl esterase/lipase